MNVRRRYYVKKSRIYTGLVALSAAGALVLSGCSANGGDSGGDASAKGGVVSVNSGEPQRPLIPSDTAEVNGGKIIDLVFSGLASYDAEGKTQLEMAESIESDDNKLWTIKIKKDMKFSDGTPVNADSFINAWSFGANKANNHLGSYFFSEIVGFSFTEPVEKLEGLKKVDDLTFTVELVEPAADFGTRLGYSAYVPLPEVAYEDIEAFGKLPVGNGPYKLESAINPQSGVKLVPNEEYTGEKKVANAGIDFKFYADTKAAYADLLSGNLDILDAIPSSAFENYEADLGDRAVNQPVAVFQSFLIPSSLEGFSGEEGALRRAAISRAIDRDQITDKIFKGTRSPAKDFTSPVIEGFTADIPGNEVLTFDKDEAKKLWEQANAMNPWPADRELKISYNADGDHQAWVDAVANSIKNNLDIKALGNPVPTFESFREQITNRTIGTAFRTGWQADYPGLFNFLGPIYGTGAGSNDGDYSNPEFDKLIQQGNAAPSAEEANEYYVKAQEILFKDLPAIPLWNSNVTGGYGDKVDNVVFGWNSVPLLNEVTKKG